MIHDFNLSRVMIDTDQLNSIRNALIEVRNQVETKIYVDVVDSYEALLSNGPKYGTGQIDGPLSMALGACHILQDLVEEAIYALENGDPLPWEV